MWEELFERKTINLLKMINSNTKMRTTFDKSHSAILIENDKILPLCFVLSRICPLFLTYFMIVYQPVRAIQ